MPEFKDDIFSVTFGITFETTSVFSRFPVIELITSWPDDIASFSTLANVLNVLVANTNRINTTFFII